MLTALTMDTNLTDPLQHLFTNPGAADAIAAEPLHVLGISGRALLETDGVDVVRFRIPAGAFAPPHRHHQEEESFVILSGEVKLTIDGRDTVARAGQSVTFPRGSLHAFENVSGAEAEVLVVLTPGNAGGLRFYREISKLPTLDQQIRHVVRLAAEDGIEVPPPPL